MKIEKKVNSWMKEIISHKLLYILLFLLLLGAFFVRVYRVSDLLGFYYDQGRDALVIWKLWHEGKFFLIGPVTGLAGIFLGPFYYYLIAPFYLISGGNPVVPAIFLAFLSTAAIYLLYFLGRQMHSREAGIFASLVGALSYYIVLTSRWLANPNPILLTSLLFLWSLWEIANIKKKAAGPEGLWPGGWWIAAAFLAGVSLHFESASAIFYIPILGVFFIWQWKNFPGVKALALSLGAFLLTLLPQIIFNFRHENIFLNNFLKLFFQEKGFRPITKFMLEVRSEFFWNVFSQKIFPGWPVYAAIFFLLLGLVLFVSRKRFKRLLTLFLIFLMVPMVGYLFFQGNYTVVYDYYMSGYYLPFILLFGIGLAELWRSKGGAFVVAIFFAMFFLYNGTLLKDFLTDERNGSTDISYRAELSAVDWVFENAGGTEFNVDVYVPPVIPYAYDYLFLWQGLIRCGESLCGLVEDRQVPRLYTLYEQDPPHPERLEAWLARQAGIGRVEEETIFAGITVQRRSRL